MNSKKLLHFLLVVVPFHPIPPLNRTKSPFNPIFLEELARSAHHSAIFHCHCPNDAFLRFAARPSSKFVQKPLASLPNSCTHKGAHGFSTQLVPKAMAMDSFSSQSVGVIGQLDCPVPPPARPFGPLSMCNNINFYRIQHTKAPTRRRQFWPKNGCSQQAEGRGAAGWIEGKGSSPLATNSF